MIDQLQAFNILLDVIKTGKRHKYYKETVQLAKDYKAYSTGIGLDEKLKRVNSRQSEEAFDEQKKVTVHITKSIISALTHIYNRVPRSNSVKTSWKATNESQNAEFEKILDNFGRSGFDDYMEDRMKDIGELDPNAFVVCEFLPTDGTTRAEPYPYEVKSEHAVMYEYELSRLKYLIDKNSIKQKTKTGTEVDTEIYTIYTDVGAVKVVEMPDNNNYTDLKKAGEQPDIPEFFNIERKSYEVLVPEAYELPVTPARQVGYITNKEHEEIYVNYYDSIVPFLEKLIKANSEMDISIAKHVHPQKIQYVEKCDHAECHKCDTDGIFKIWATGNDPDQPEIEILCPSCKGTGRKNTTSSGIEVIYLPIPEAMDNVNLQMPDLSNIVHYIAVDINTPQFLGEYIDKLIAMCRRTMFNQENLSGDEAAKVLTATEIIINDDNRSDTLRPYAVNYVNNYDFYLRLISEITEIPIEIQAEVSKDFNMRGLAEWTEILNQLITAGANEYIIASVQVEIWRLLHGATNVSNEYKTAVALIPFINLTPEMKAMTMAQLDKKDKYRVAAIYGNSFLQQLKIEDENYFKLPFEERKRRFDELVQARIDEMQPEQPTNPFLNE